MSRVLELAVACLAALVAPSTATDNMASSGSCNFNTVYVTSDQSFSVYLTQSTSYYATISSTNPWLAIRLYVVWWFRRPCSMRVHPITQVSPVRMRKQVAVPAGFLVS